VKELTEIEMPLPIKIYFLDIPICRCTVFPSRFFVVARLAQRLPVAFVPKQIFITSVRSDMVNDRCFSVSSLLQTLGAERMLFKVPLADLLPAAAIPTP